MYSIVCSLMWEAGERHACWLYDILAWCSTKFCICSKGLWYSFSHPTFGPKTPVSPSIMVDTSLNIAVCCCGRKESIAEFSTWQCEIHGSTTTHTYEIESKEQDLSLTPGVGCRDIAIDLFSIQGTEASSAIEVRSRSLNMNRPWRSPLS